MVADVAVIGAGVIGAAIAYELSLRASLRVTVVERGTPGCEASNAAAGLLTVASSRARSGVLFEARRTSADLFPALVNALEVDTGRKLGYQRVGVLRPAYSPAEVEELREQVSYRRRQNLAAEMLDRNDLRRVEPAISDQAIAAASFADDAAIDSQRFVAALVGAAARRGVSFRFNTSVRALSLDGGTARLQVDEGSFTAGLVVVAAGAWSAPLLHACGIKVPLRPARGEMVSMRPDGWELRRVVSSGETYLLPRCDGEVFIGSTVAFVGFEKLVSAEGVAAMLERAAALVPAIRSAPVERAWAGLRPCSTIRRPLITPLPGMRHVILATGHYRNGIVLAPLTARLVADMVTGAPPSFALAPFAYRKR